jgi:isocitrate/isopropylmalate dehydrogenase
MAAILAGALMLESLGLDDAARSVEAAVRDALTEDQTTPDLGGNRSTEEVARWIAERLS